MIKVWVRDIEKEEDEDWMEKKIENDISNPTTEISYDVQHCKVYEVSFEFFLDADDSTFGGYEIYPEETVTTNPNKKELQTKFMEYTYDNSSKVLNWDYTQLMNDFDCLERFSYKLVKDENGDTEDLKEGNDEDRTKGNFNVGALDSKCNFAVRTEIEYETGAGHIDKLDGFEIHIQQKDQKDNSIDVNETSISFEVNPCVAEHEEDVVIGLAEVEREGRGIHGRVLESSLTTQVPVEKSISDIKRSQFDEADLKSCVAYKIMLLRRSNTDFKELETADFSNPKWNTWKAPSLQSIQTSSSSITFNLTDNETGGECSVRHYNISCTEVGEEESKEKEFMSNEKLSLDGLLPETEYNCTGRIVHTIPGAGDFDTPWADFIVVETNEAQLTTLAPTPDLKQETDLVADDGDAGNSEGQTAEAAPNSDPEPDADGVVAGISIAIVIVLILLGVGIWWKYKKSDGGKDPNDGLVPTLSYRASTTAGHKTVEMNSSVMTDTEEDVKEDTENGKTEETVIDIPEENKATTSTGGIPSKDVPNKEESDSKTNTDQVADQPIVPDQDPAQVSDKIPTPVGDQNPAVASAELNSITNASEVSSDAAVPPKEPNV